MEWLETRLYTTNEGIEPVCAVLLTAGVDGFEIEDDADMKEFLSANNGQWDYVDEELMNKPIGETCIRFYVGATAFGNEMLAAVRDGLSFLRETGAGIPLGRLELETTSVDDADWLNNWKKHFKPLEIGRNIVIRPAWEEYANADGKTVFSIEPGHVFGTGLHQTTQLCIEQIEKHITPGMSVLDIGCGTGILSVIALMLGAAEAAAVDTDPNAIDIAYENAELNGIGRDKYTVLHGNILRDEPLRGMLCGHGYDIVIANIVADVVIALAQTVPECLKPGGVFISSGIIRERLDEVTAALTANGLNITEVMAKDDWYCVVCRC